MFAPGTRGPTLMAPTCVTPETRQKVAEGKSHQVVLLETVEAQIYHRQCTSNEDADRPPFSHASFTFQHPHHKKGRSEVSASTREALRARSVSPSPTPESRDCIPAARELKRPRRLKSRAQTDIYLAFGIITDVRRRNPALQPLRRTTQRTPGRSRPPSSRPMAWK
jgi:hypothetical protein